MVELLINNIYIPVTDSIVSDVEANDIGSATVKSGDISASFTIEATPENLIAFNNIYNRKHNAKVVNDGMVLSTGYVVISEYTQKRKQLTLDYFGEISDIISLLEGKTLRDLDWSDLDHDKTYDNIVSSWSNEEGYMYPIVDLNNVNTRTSLSFNPNDFTPAVFLSTTVKKILNSIGYKLKGSILNDYIFNRAVLLYYPDQGRFEGIGKTYMQSYCAFGGVSNNTSSPGYFYATDYLTLVSYKDFQGTPQPWVTRTGTLNDVSERLDQNKKAYIVPFDGLLKIWGYFRIEPSSKTLDIKINGATVKANPAIRISVSA